MTEPRKLTDIFTELIDTAVNVIDSALRDAVKDHPAFKEKPDVDEELPLIDVPIEWTKVNLDYTDVMKWEAGTLIAKVVKSRFKQQHRVIFGLWVKYSPDHHQLPSFMSTETLKEGTWGVIDFANTWQAIRDWDRNAEDNYLVYQPKPS